MIKTASISALQTGKQVEVGPGDILEVSVSFDYIVSQPTTTEFWVSLIILPGRDYTVKRMIELEEAVGTKKWSGVIEMPITASLGLKNYTYSLYAEIIGYKAGIAYTVAVDKAESAIIITGMGGGGGLDIMSMMIMVMMMSIMMPMMEEGT